ncbi:MAG TPA: hypothetical protein VF941_09870 [Clostridia bacterium]
MTNEEFQMAVLEELRGMKGEIRGIKEEIGGIKEEIGGVKEEIGGVKGEVGGIKGEVGGIKGEVEEIKTRVSNIEVRQDEIYQIVRAIEHSNQVGRSELDVHNLRLAKVEGKLKRIAKAYNEEIDVDNASNL